MIYHARVIRRWSYLHIASLVSLLGCNQAPIHQCSDIAISYHICEGSDQDCDFVTWWQRLEDPILNQLLVLAEAQNLDLKIASMQVLQARASPRSYVSMAREEALEEQLCSTWVALSTETAKNYIELRGCQLRRKLYQARIDAGETEEQLTQQLRQRGVISDKALSEATLDQLALHAELPVLELRISTAIHRISVLIGCHPEDLLEYLCCETPLPALPSSVPMPCSSGLLGQHPAILKAEKDFETVMEQAPFGITALLPRFLLQRLTCDKPATQELLYRYQKTVLETFEGLENAIAAYCLGEQRLHYLEESCRIQAHSLAQEKLLYEQGVNDYISLLNTSRQAFLAQDLLIQGQVEQLLNYVMLYKALGGNCD